MSAKAAPPRRGETRKEIDLYTDLYRRMVLIRRFEDAVQSLFLAGEVHGTTHLYSGQEAVAVGIASVLSEGDQVAGTYRGHGCASALGLSPQALMDELLGRATGICAGRAGSMNFVDREHGLIGCFSIVRRKHHRGHRGRACAARQREAGSRLLRRRCRQSGLLRGVPELRQSAVPAGGLRVREQSLRRVHTV